MSAEMRIQGVHLNSLFYGFSETAGGTTTRRFSVLGAKSVTIMWKSVTGTPTITIGGYVHPKATRDATLTNYDCVTKLGGGAAVTDGQYAVVYASAAAADFVTPAGDIIMPLAELDIRAAGNCTGFDVTVLVQF